MGFAKIGAMLALDGASEFKAQLSSSNAALREIKSEMKAVAAQFDGSANSMEALTKKGDLLQRQYEAQTEKISLYKKAIEDSKEAEEKSEKKIKELHTALADATKEMDNMKNSSTATEEELEQQQKKIESLKGQLKGASTEYVKAENNTSKWRSSLNNAEADLYTLDNEITKNKKYLSEAEKSTNNTAKSIDEYGNEVKEASEDTLKFGDVLKANLASELIIDGVKALAGAVKELSSSAAKVGMEYEASMSQVAATMGMTAEEINNGSEAYAKLEQAAQECGETTKYSAAQSAEALNYLALAGYDVDKAVEALPKVLKLASAGGMELGETSDLVTDAMSALNLETSELDRFIDQLAKTSQKSNTDVRQLGNGILTVGGTATQLKGNITELNTLLGIFADNGIKGAEGGTHLRNIILAMNPTTDDACAAFKRLNLSAYDADGNLRGLNEVFQDLNQAMDGMTAKEKQDILTDIFNKTDLAAVQALLKNCGDRFGELSGYIEESNGAAQDMANTMENNLKGKITTLQSAAEALGITFYGKMEGSLTSATVTATNSISRLNAELKSGDLGESVDRLAESFSKSADGMLEFAEDALPHVVNGLTWILDNGDAIVSAIAGIGAATAANMVAGQIQTVVSAWRDYKTATDGATVAQWLLNAAQNANPLGMLATAIVAITTALAVYSITTRGAAEEQDELIISSNELTEKTKTLREEIQNGRDARKENKAAIEEEYGAMKILSDQLFELVAKEDKSNVEKQRMADLVDQLNETFPDLNLEIDKQTGALNRQQKEIEGVIQAMMEQAKAEAARKDMVEIAEAQYKAEKSLHELEDKRTELTEKLTEKQAELNKQLDSTNGYLDTYGDMSADGTNQTAELLKEINGLQEGIQNCNSEIGLQAEEVSRTNQEFENASEYVANYGTKMEEAATAADEMKNTYIELGDQVYEVNESTIGSLDELIGKYNEALTDAQASIHGQVGLFNELKVESDLTIDQMIERFEEQSHVMDEWANNLQLAAERGVNQGLLQQLADAGVSSAGYLQEIVKASDESIEELNAAFGERLQAEQYASTEMAGVQTQFKDSLAAILADANQKADEMNGVGADMAEGLDGGFASAFANVRKNIVGKVSSILGSIREALDSHSPSRKMIAIGEDAGAGLEIGAVNSLNHAKDEIHGIISEIANDRFSFGSQEMPETKNVAALRAESNNDVVAILRKYLPDIAGQRPQLVVDANSVVKELTPGMNTQIESQSGVEGRGKGALQR